MPTRIRGFKEERKTHSQEKIANVMRNVHRQTHVRKVKPITQPDQRQRDDMMGHQLLKVLPWLLQHEQQHAHLLQPVARLDEIVCFECSRVQSVRKAVVHGPGVEVPERGLVAHDVQAERTEDAKVYGRVGLFHEASLLRAGAEVGAERGAGSDGSEDTLHDKLAGE